MNSTQGSGGGGIATDPSPSHKGCGRAAGSHFWKPLFHLVKQGSELTVYLNMEVMSYLPMMKLECRPIKHPGNRSKGQKNRVEWANIGAGPKKRGRRIFYS